MPSGTVSTPVLEVTYFPPILGCPSASGSGTIRLAKLVGTNQRLVLQNRGYLLETV